MNFSDVSLQMLSREQLRTEGTMFAHIIMNFFDVLCQAEYRHFFSTARALFLDSRVDDLHVLGELRRPYLFLALRALSCVAHVSFPNMAFYVSRVDYLVAITALLLWPMDAFDVQGEILRFTESFLTLRTLVGHLRTSCSTRVVNSFLIKFLRITSLLNGQPHVFLNLCSAI